MIKKIASAILVFNLYSWVTTIELIPIGHIPIKVMTEMSKVLSVNKLAVINDNTGNQYNINISAVDAKSVEKLFKKNGRNLVKGLANQSFKSTGRGQAVWVYPYFRAER